MISYKIIKQDVFTDLQKLSESFPFEKAILIKTNHDLIQKIQLLNQKMITLEHHLQNEQKKNLQISKRLEQADKKLQQTATQLQSSTENQKFLSRLLSETSFRLEEAFRQKIKLQKQKLQLQTKISDFEVELQRKHKKNCDIQTQNQLFEYQITQLDSILNHFSKQKDALLINQKQKSELISNLHSQLETQNQLIQKTLSDYQACIRQKEAFEIEIHTLKQSSIGELQQKLKTKEAWIEELTKTISQLRQRCIELQMDSPQPSLPYSLPGAPFLGDPLSQYVVKNQTNYLGNPLNVNLQDIQGRNSIQKTRLYQLKKSLNEEAERMKYLKICKKLVQQFNKKLQKLKTQKKSTQKRYQSIKLKLNEYQYKEFKYKDKISLYLEKIEKFQKLTEKQQLEMQKLIIQFDEELNNVLKIKEQEVKMRFCEEIEKYQNEIRKVKPDDQSSSNNSISEQFNQMKESHHQISNELSDFDSFELNILKKGFEKTESEMQAKAREVEKLQKCLSQVKKQLEKCQQSKKRYKQRFINQQQQGYQKSREIRRLKEMIQELSAEVQLKTRQNQMLKNMAGGEHSDFKIMNRASGINYQHDFSSIQNLFFEKSFPDQTSSSNSNTFAKSSANGRYQFQVSEVDTQINKRNQTLIEKAFPSKELSPKQLQQLNNPLDQHTLKKQSLSLMAEDRHKELQGEIKQLISLMSKSEFTSQSLSQSIVSNSQLDSVSSQIPKSGSSKKSNKSYGIENLYSPEKNSERNKLLHHKSSLQ